MRHTRNRQLIKLGIDGDLNNIRIDEKRNPNSFWFSWHHLDPTFKWHRELVNRVEFDIKAGSMKGTVILPVKWKECSK